MNQKVKTIIITCIILLVIIVLVIINTFRPKLSQNPDNFVGNTASNLYNGGTFCEYNGKVFFSNSNDNNALYVMNSDETKASKVTDTSAISINVDSHRIYYSMAADTNGTGLGYIRKTAGLYSISHRGNSSTCYTTNPVSQVLLYGNKLYYSNYQKSSGTTIFSITTDREDNHEVIRQLVSLVDPYGDYIYFGNMNGDHYLYSFDPYTEASSPVIEKDVYLPVMCEDGWLYYMDPTDDYSLKKYNPSSEEEITLSEERLEFYNKYDNLIYYQTNGKSPELRRMSADGNNDVLIAEGIYTNLQTTSNYVYFRSYDNPSVTYHASHAGGSVEQFIPKK